MSLLIPFQLLMEWNNGISLLLLMIQLIMTRQFRKKFVTSKPRFAINSFRYKISVTGKGLGHHQRCFGFSILALFYP